MSDSRDNGTAHYSFSTVTGVGKRRKRKFQKNLLNYHMPVMAEKSHVLEVGSGRGEFADECLEAGYEYTGVEPSKSLCEQLVARGLSVVETTVPPLDFPDETFDLVHSMDLVEHFASYDIVLKYFVECRRVLKQKGYVSVIVPNYSLLGRLFYEYEYQHTYQTTEDRIINLLIDSGFRMVKSGKFLFPWAVKSKLHSVLDRMLANILVPLGRSYLLSGILKGVAGRDFVFRVHKNLFDHIGVIAQKLPVEI